MHTVLILPCLDVSIHVDEDWYVVSNGIGGKDSREGAVHPSASEHMYLV